MTTVYNIYRWNVGTNTLEIYNYKDCVTNILTSLYRLTSGNYQSSSVLLECKYLCIGTVSVYNNFAYIVWDGVTSFKVYDTTGTLLQPYQTIPNFTTSCTYAESLFVPGGGTLGRPPIINTCTTNIIVPTPPQSTPPQPPPTPPSITNTTPGNHIVYNINTRQLNIYVYIDCTTKLPVAAYQVLSSSLANPTVVECGYMCIGTNSILGGTCKIVWDGTYTPSSSVGITVNTTTVVLPISISTNIMCDTVPKLLDQNGVPIGWLYEAKKCIQPVSTTTEVGGVLPQGVSWRKLLIHSIRVPIVVLLITILCIILIND